MWLEKLFETFHRKVKLNPDRVERIESAYTTLQSFLKEDGPLSAVFLDLFKQGSFAINTAIKPVDEQREFDLDAVFVLDVPQLPWNRQSPSEAIAWVARRLRENRDYAGKISERKRCVRPSPCTAGSSESAMPSILGGSGVAFKLSLKQGATIPSCFPAAVIRRSSAGSGTSSPLTPST